MTHTKARHSQLDLNLSSLRDKPSLQQRLLTKSVKTLKTLSITFALGLSSFHVAAHTPNHVYQAVDNLAHNINSVRRHLKVNETAREPGVQIAKTPLHAYTKGLEVYEKVIRFKQTRNLSSAPLPSLPTQKVTPSDVLVLVESIEAELKAVTDQLGLEFKEPAPYPYAKTPSDVYENIWRTSYLLDGLTGAISPKDVYQNTLRIEEALNRIAANMSIAMPKEEPELPQGKSPVDANIEGFKVLYKLVALEKKLHMTPLRVSGFPAGNISPSDVYDTTNNIITELTRINIALSLPAAANAPVIKDNVTPNHVVQKFKKIQLQLDNLTN